MLIVLTVHAIVTMVMRVMLTLVVMNQKVIHAMMLQMFRFRPMHIVHHITVAAHRNVQAGRAAADT